MYFSFSVCNVPWQASGNWITMSIEHCFPLNYGTLHEESVSEAILCCTDWENLFQNRFFFLLWQLLLPFIFSLTYGAVITEETHCVVHGNSLSDTDPLHREGLERKQDGHTLADWPLEHGVQFRSLRLLWQPTNQSSRSRGGKPVIKVRPKGSLTKHHRL